MIENNSSQIINFVEEDETDSSALARGAKMSDAVKQALMNARIRLKEAEKRKKTGHPFSQDELHAGTAVIGMLKENQ